MSALVITWQGWDLERGCDCGAELKNLSHLFNDCPLLPQARLDLYGICIYRMGHLTFGIWIGYKKSNIQMTAMAGLTVPHSINHIFQYTFYCLGKRSIRKSKRHHREADAPTTSDCLVRILVRSHHWAIFLRKWARSRRYGQWRALACHAQRIFVSKNWRGWHGLNLVSTGRGHLPHSHLWDWSPNNRKCTEKLGCSNGVL